jgi:hypothetical protein
MFFGLMGRSWSALQSGFFCFQEIIYPSDELVQPHGALLNSSLFAEILPLFSVFFHDLPISSLGRAEGRSHRTNSRFVTGECLQNKRPNAFPGHLSELLWRRKAEIIVSQCDYGIDTAGASCRKISRDECDRGQQNRYGDDRQG